MDLDARPYRAFVRVAETGSFSRAALDLHVSQPALSAQVRELERRLGFALFTRNSRTVILTAEGNLFLDKARRFIVETDWINQAAREIASNQLRIGAAHFSAQITERRALIEAFLLANPGAPVQIIGRSHAQLFDDLARERVDIAVTIEPYDAESIVRSAVEPTALDYPRWIIAERPVCVIVPDRGDRSPICAAELGTLAIATLNRAHGVALSEAVARLLSAGRATALHPPEADGPALLRHAAFSGQAVIDLGWFGPPPAGMVARTIEGAGLSTALTVIAASGARRSHADNFLAMLRDP